MKAYTRTEQPTAWKLRDNIVDIQAQGWKCAIEGPNGWHPESMYLIIPDLEPGDIVSVLSRGQFIHLFGTENGITIRADEDVHLTLRDGTS